MKFVSLTVWIFLFCSTTYGQPWLRHLPAHIPQEELTLYDYQQAFETYWAPFNVQRGTYTENGVTKKASGWKQFKRWEYELESRIEKQTGAFPKKSALTLREEYESTRPQRSPGSTGNWSALGPRSSFSGYAGIGRLNCVAFHPTDLNIWWVGAAAGGLWVTTDHGASWTCLTDNNGVLAVSDIAIAPDYESSRTIYIATGDRDGWDNRSIGVLKSTDGGLTWNATGLTYTIYEGRMTNRLLMDPNQPEVLIAATTVGVYKTTDGGTTWNTRLTTTEFIDMEFHPGNSNMIYGATKNGRIHRSTDGITFSPAFSDPDGHRVELAVSPEQPDRVYAVMSNGESGLLGIYKSENSGVSFTQVFSGASKNMLGWESSGAGTGGQGWYDLAMAASPINADVVLVGGVNTWRSTDGGLTWSIVNHWWGDGVQAVHADKHNLVFRKNGDLFECNDGGIYVSTNNGSNWTDRTNGIEISQMYRLSVSQTDPGDIITGLQDNGTKLLSGEVWHDVRGGDGMECLIDYTNVNIQYSTLYFGAIDRTLNHWQNAQNISPASDGAWITPFIIDPQNPQILYAGYSEVWKTVNRGNDWDVISSLNVGGKIRAMAIAPSDPQTLYISGPSNVWKTMNGGTTWTSVSSGIPVGNADVQSIAIRHDDPATVWVAFSSYSHPGVYQTQDKGASWTNISNGLPPIPVYSVVQNHQATGEIELFAGTELGVYFKKGEEEWRPYSSGLPNVRIGEIEIYYAPDPSKSKLRAATYGRGMWETPIEYIPAPMVFISANTVQNNWSKVAPDQTDQEIIKVEIVTNGNLFPLEVSSFTFSTEGSTHPGMDITAAKLFYTGTNSQFSAGIQFGNTIAAPDGEFIITGTQSLLPGKNHFWLTYDISVDATTDNLLDAQCLSVVIDSVRTLTATNPTGNRTIGIEYCQAGSIEPDWEYIAGVAMGEVIQLSGKGTGGYQDFSSSVIDMQIGVSQDITVTIESPYFSDELLIWVDWNKDGNFDDASEKVFSSGVLGSASYTTSFAPPPGAKTGLTRMRIRLNDTENGSNNLPCGNASWGEVEDYSLFIYAPDPCGPLHYFAHNVRNIPGDYVRLEAEGTVIPTSEWDNANSGPQDIGFEFEFECEFFHQFVLNTNGFVKLGSTPPSAAALFFDGPRSKQGGPFNNNHPQDVNILSPLNLDLTGEEGSTEYRVYTSGSSPYRVCTIQFRNVTEATSDPLPHYTRMEFQIKLYETSNIIEFVYGDWTPSGHMDDFRTAACGIKGSGRQADQLLLLNKGALESWDQVRFANTSFFYAEGINYSSPPESPAPDEGRTLRFVPLYKRDLSVGEIYALGEASVYYSSPQTVSVQIINVGKDTMSDIPVSLRIGGANTQDKTIFITSLAPGHSAIVPFSGYRPDSLGLATFEISLPDDDHAELNQKEWAQQTGEYSVNYADAGSPAIGLLVPDGEEWTYFASYHVAGTAEVKAVKAFIPYHQSNTGQTVFGVVLNDQGEIAAQSELYVIQPADLGTWITFNFSIPLLVMESNFYAGLSVTSSDQEYYMPGVQVEDPQRPETFYRSSIDGSGLSPFYSGHRLMIGAELAPTPPAPGITSSSSPVCIDDNTTLTLSGHSGHIQWQSSEIGMDNWAKATTGAGMNTPVYTTPPLLAGMQYRAEINQPTFPSVYSNVSVVEVIDRPADAGLIMGDTILCQDGDPILYTIDEIQYAESYEWTLPPGATGSGTDRIIEVTFGDAALSGTISVSGRNAGCSGGPSSLDILVLEKPVKPVIVAIDHILISDAPAGNQWYNEHGPIEGATEPEFIATENGTYYVIVTLEECVSEPSNTIQLVISAVDHIRPDWTFRAIPNPASTELLIEVPEIEGLFLLSIMNHSGQTVYVEKLSGKKLIQVEHFLSGVYFIQLENKSGKRVKRVVKI